MKARLLALGAGAVSGLLMYAAFPPAEVMQLGWLALAPLLLACRRAGPGLAFMSGLACGLTFWLFSLSWITHVTSAGWFILSAACALLVAGFAAAASDLSRRLNGMPAENMLLMLGWPALWVGVETLRTQLGFSWNALGVSQYRNLGLIQCAAWGGVGAVSFILVLVSSALALTFERYIAQGRCCARRPSFELMAAALVLAAAVLGGNRTLRGLAQSRTNLRAAIVQPNIPQVQKWSDEFIDFIYGRLDSGTRAALRAPGLDIVVWPETATPDFLRYSTSSWALVSALLTNGVPMLIGSMDAEFLPGDSMAPPSAFGQGRPARRGFARYFNVSMLFEPGIEEPRVYDKQHLVIFGEYIPFEEIIPFFRNLTPIETSFSPGSGSACFPVPRRGHLISPLICFEDTLPWLARAAVRSGARLLVNQTNDAWFDESAASRQHMSHCVFRCVENRVPAIRAANTGVSCVIDRTGAVRDRISRVGPGAEQADFLVADLWVPPADMPLTVYSRTGDALGLGCVVIWLAFALLRTRLFPGSPER